MYVGKSLLYQLVLVMPGNSSTFMATPFVAAETTTETCVLCESVPLLPPIVTVYVPAAADFVVVNVSVELPEVEIELGEKLPPTPAGNPETPSSTDPVKPFCAATVAVNVVDLPAVTDCDDGAAVIVKSPLNVTAFTFTLTVVLCASVPLVPVIVSVYVPAAVEVVVETFSVQLPDPVIDPGLQLASMPAGMPLSTSPTVPENPFEPATLTVKLVLFPAVMVCEEGAAEIEKSGGGLLAETVTLTVVL
jgi:hypothetical protein